MPCVGGLIGSRLARRLVARFGQRTVMLSAGALRACWLPGLAFVRPGAAGLVLVMAVELGMIVCIGVFNPVLATYRLEQIPADRVARTLSAWSVTSKATIAALTALWGVLASVTSLRAAIAVAGLLLLATPLLLPRAPARPVDPERELDQQPGQGPARDHVREPVVVTPHERGPDRQPQHRQAGERQVANPGRLAGHRASPPRARSRRTRWTCARTGRRPAARA